jgi:hypothetical protein
VRTGEDLRQLLGRDHVEMGVGVDEHTAGTECGGGLGGIAWQGFPRYPHPPILKVLKYPF